MKNEIAKKLEPLLVKISEIYSNPKRARNGNKEIFRLNKIVPLDNAAIAIYDKTGGKQAACFLYFVNYKEGFWSYFFPTQNHILAFRKFEEAWEKIERKNFELNFKGDKDGQE